MSPNMLSKCLTWTSKPLSLSGFMRNFFVCNSSRELKMTSMALGRVPASWPTPWVVESA